MISVMKLKRSGQMKSMGNSSRNSECATTTILILTAAYILLNIPYCMMYFLRAISIYSNGAIEPYMFIRGMSKELYAFITNFNLTFTIALNSTINPLIYFARVPQLRNFILRKDGLRSLKASLTPRKDVIQIESRRKSSAATISDNKTALMKSAPAEGVVHDGSRRRSSAIALGMVAVVALRQQSHLGERRGSSVVQIPEKWMSSASTLKYDPLSQHRKSGTTVIVNSRERGV